MDVNFNFYASGYGTAQVAGQRKLLVARRARRAEQSTADPTHSIEYVYVPSTYSGTAAYSIQFADTAYRSFRLTSLTGNSF